TTVSLQWSAALDNVRVTKYLVFQDGAQVASAPGFSTQLANVTPGRHHFQVQATDAAGNVSANGPTTDIVIDVTPPTWPAPELATLVSGTAVPLKWNLATDDVGLAGYRIFEDGAAIGDLPSSSHTTDVIGVTEDVDHLFAVQAFDAAGNVSTNGPTAHVR